MKILLIRLLVFGLAFVVVDSKVRAAEPLDAGRRVDVLGDPLPHGAIARLGTVRFRHGDQINAVASQGDILATGARDGTVTIWVVTTGRERFWLSASGTVFCVAISRDVHPSGARTVAFTPDGGSLLVAANNNSLELWDVANATRQRTYPGHRGIVTSISVAPDGKLFTTGNTDKTILIWQR